jgi:hypothetical protein
MSPFDRARRFLEGRGQVTTLAVEALVREFHEVELDTVRRECADVRSVHWAYRLFSLLGAAAGLTALYKAW